MKKLLRNKNFVLLFTGAFVSEIGNMMFAFAMALYIYAITGSSSMMAVFMAISVFVRVIVSPFAGPLVDRLNKIRVIYVTDFIRGFMFVGLGYLFYQGIEDVNTILIYLYITTIVSSINAAFFFPAASSSVPDIVGEENLQQAQGVQGFLMAIPQLIGGFLGAGFLDTVGVNLIIMINGVSFILSGLSEMFIRTPFKKEVVLLPKEERNSLLHDYKESLRYIKHINLLGLVMFFLLVNFAVTPLFSVGTPVLFKGILARESTMEYAFTGATFSIAAMIGSILIGSIKLKSYKATIRKAMIVLFVMFVTNVVLFYLVEFSIIPYWWFYYLYIANILIVGMNLSFLNLPINVGLTLEVEPEMRGRVFSTVGAIAQMAIPFSMILGGVVLENNPITLLGIICIVLLVVPTLGFLTSPSVNKILNKIDEKQALMADQQTLQKKETELQEA